MAVNDDPSKKTAKKSETKGKTVRKTGTTVKSSQTASGRKKKISSEAPATAAEPTAEETVAPVSAMEPKEPAPAASTTPLNETVTPASAAQIKDLASAASTTPLNETVTPASAAQIKDLASAASTTPLNETVTPASAAQMKDLASAASTTPLNETVTPASAAQMKDLASAASTIPLNETVTPASAAQIKDLASAASTIPLKAAASIVSVTLPKMSGLECPIHSGEFRGDFTRDTYNATNHFTRVLMQQGRVQLDADWNEQASILLHYLQSLARDLIGPYGGSGYSGSESGGFKIGKVNNDKFVKDLDISAGHYYVNGILCENEVASTYLTQPNYPNPDSLPEPPYLVYLDVWEHHITCINKDNIREIALNGPDTATRSQIIWQVKILPFSQDELKKISVTDTDETSTSTIVNNICKEWTVRNGLSGKGFRGNCPKIRARAKIPPDPSQVCIVQPDASYRGPENQLYRLEVNTPGPVNAATIKWSRDNGSVVFPIVEIVTSKNGTSSATLANLGRDNRSTLVEGDWVELLDDDIALQQKPGNLVKIKTVDRSNLIVTFATPVTAIPQVTKHALVRRWDYRENPKGEIILGNDGAILIKEGLEETNWMELEDGVQVQFQHNGDYHFGDYWLIPARVILGDIEWPRDGTNPLALPPHGIAHFYAPLAVVITRDGEPFCFDCRCVFPPACPYCAQQHYDKSAAK